MTNNGGPESGPEGLEPPWRILDRATAFRARACRGVLGFFARFSTRQEREESEVTSKYGGLRAR